MKTGRTTSRGARARGGFTLTELLVVISLLVLLIAIAVPSFSSIMYNNERAQAENQLRAGVAAARDAAIQSVHADSLAVFVFAPNGRTLIYPAVQAGSLDDEVLVGSPSAQPNRNPKRDVFVLSPGAEPVQLPRGWMVRGYAPPLTAGSVIAGNNPSTGWYDSPDTMASGTEVRGNWVFPETSFYNPSTADDGWKRQTFAIRFEGGTGALAIADGTECLIVDPSPASALGGFRTAQPFSSYRFDTSTDAASLVRRILVMSESALTLVDKRRLLGDRSVDTILARPVAEIALYDERHLAGAIGARGLSKATGTLYGDPATPAAYPSVPRFDSSLFAGLFSPDRVTQDISTWIEGRYKNGNRAVESDARLFTFQQYLGQMQEVTP